MPDLSARHLQPEEMDRPGLDAGRHAQALRGLALINLLSGSAGILWPPVRDLARRLGRPLRLLDVATGGGDVLLRLWQKACCLNQRTEDRGQRTDRGRSDCPLALAGCDRSLTALDVARRAAERAGAPVEFFEIDALTDELPTGYDVVACSLFLHHLSADEAVGLLAKLRRAAGELVLVNDLRRCRAGMLLAWLGTRLLSRSRIVHVDGPRSVAAAFTPAEALALADRAGWPSATVARRWPCRYLLTGPGGRS
jgi:hypothetical protein